MALSTINPLLPSSSSGLSSAVLRANFLAAYNDINNLGVATPFTQSGLGATLTDLQTRARKIFYPSDYGAVGNGGSHPLSNVYPTLAAAQAAYPFATSLSQELDFCGLQACVNAAGAARGAVDMTCTAGYVFHPSLDTLQLNNTNCPEGLFLRGAGSGNFASAIIKNSSSTDTIRVTGFGFLFQDFAIIDFLTATGGSAINAQGAQFSYFIRIRTTSTFNGIDFSNGTANLTVHGCLVRDVAAAGFGMKLGGSTCSISDSVVQQIGGGGDGLLITDGDSWLIANTEVEGFNKVLNFAPTGGQLAISNKFVNCFFDSGNYGAYFAPGTGSQVQRTVFSECWFGDAAIDGCRIAAAGGVTNGVIWAICEFVQCIGVGLGIDSGAGSSFFAGAESVFAGCGTAVSVGAGISHWAIRSSSFGPYHAFTANTNNIIISAGASDWYAIVDNILRPPAGTNLSDGGTGSNVIVKNNVGYNPVGGAAITVGASPYTYTAGHSDETIYILGGTVSIIATGGGTVANASPATIQLGPNETVTVTYSVAPTMRKSIH